MLWWLHLGRKRSAHLLLRSRRRLHQLVLKVRIASHEGLVILLLDVARTTSGKVDEADTIIQSKAALRVLYGLDGLVLGWQDVLGEDYAPNLHRQLQEGRAAVCWRDGGIGNWVGSWLLRACECVSRSSSAESVEFVCVVQSRVVTLNLFS